MPIYSFQGKKYKLSETDPEKALDILLSLTEEEAQPTPPPEREKTSLIGDIGSGLRNAAETALEGTGMALAGAASINPLSYITDKALGIDSKEAIFDLVKASRDARNERESKVDRGELGKVAQAVGAIPTYLNPLTAGAVIAGGGVNTGLTMMEQGADAPHALAGQAADTALSLAGMKLGDLANVASPIKNALLQGGINVAQEAAVAHPVENVIRRHAGIQERPDMTPGDYAAAFVPGAVIGGMTAKAHKPAEQPLPEKEVTPRTQTEEDLAKLRGNETSIFKRATFIQEQLSRFPEQMSENQFEEYTRLQEELEGLRKEFKENRTNIRRYEDALKTPEQKQAEEQAAIQAIRETDMGVAGNPTAKQAEPVDLYDTLEETPLVERRLDPTKPALLQGGTPKQKAALFKKPIRKKQQAALLSGEPLPRIIAEPIPLDPRKPALFQSEIPDLRKPIETKQKGPALFGADTAPSMSTNVPALLRPFVKPPVEAPTPQRPVKTQKSESTPVVSQEATPPNSKIAALESQLVAAKQKKGKGILEITRNLEEVNRIQKELDATKSVVPEHLVHPKSAENEAPTTVVKPQEVPVTKPSPVKTTVSPPIIPPTKPKAQPSKPPNPVVQKQQTAQQIAKTLDDPLYDIDVSKTRTAEEVVQDLKQREGVVDRAYKLGRELFGSQQLVEAVKREAPVVWEIYKRIKSTNEAITAMKYRWMYGDIPQTPDGKGPIMTLAHREAMDSIAVVKRSLTDNEKQRVHEQMMKTFASRTKHTDVDLSHLNPNEQKAVRVLTDMYERVMNDRGLKQRNGYMHTTRKGDFSVGVKNLLGDVTRVEFWPSRKDAIEFIRRAQEKGFETTDILDLKSEQGMKFAEAFETIHDILEQIDVGMNTPETRAHMEALQSFLADNAKGVHNLRKMGYSGGVGSKLLKSNRENALDWWDSIEGYLAEMAAQQKKIMLNKQSVDFFDGDAGIELKKMVPNQVETAKYLMDIAMNNQKKYGVADQIDSIKKEIDALLVSTVRSGIGAAKQIPFFGKKITADEKLWYPNVPITDKATGIAAELFYIRTLTSRPAFWAGQLLSSPFALRQFLKEGTVLDTLKAQGKGMATFMSGGDAEFRAFLKDISNTSETLIPQLHTEINELPIFGRHGNPTLSKVYELMTGKTPAAMADTLSRYMTLSIAYHFYKDMGMSGKQLQENVKQMVDDTMVVYSRAYTPPFLTKLGFAGQHIAPLQKYGLAQLQHLIGDIKHIKDQKTFRSTLPLMSTLMTTMIMSGSIGLPLLMEYEILRLALLKGGEFFGIKNMEDYLPASVMEMMLTNNRVKDAFAAGLSAFGVSEDTAKKTVSHGVVSAATGMDIGSSLRFNPFVPEPGEEISLLNAFPIVKSVLELGVHTGTKVKKAIGGDTTLADQRKADMFFAGHTVGGKALVDEARYEAATRPTVPGGNRSYGQVEQTGQERLATLLGTNTVDTKIAKAEEKILRTQDRAETEKKQKAMDLIMDGLLTGDDDQVTRNMERALKLGMTMKQIRSQIDTLERNRDVPSLIRRFSGKNNRPTSSKQIREFLKQQEYE